jgi:hypothetical protein
MGVTTGALKGFDFSSAAREASAAFRCASE